MAISKIYMGLGIYLALNELHQEHRLNAEIIELCLAHTDKNEVRASYNQAERIAEKRELMSFYAKFIDEVKRGERD